MAIETAKNKICMHQIVEKMQDEIFAEGDVIVNDIKPDILNIISTNGTVCVYKKEVTDGKIRIDGRINTYIIYLANDENGSTRTLNTSLDFTYVTEISTCKAGMIFDENINLKKIECKVLNERKINVKAFLNIQGILYSDENIEIISKIEGEDDIQVLNTNKKINSLIGNGTTKVFAKDTLRVEDNIAEIMKVNTKILNKSMKISYNKVLAKSELNVSIVYLTEDNRICNGNIVIPVMGFIDIENISDDNKCDIEYRMKNIIIKPDSNTENSIYIEAEIEISCLVYEEKEITLIEDMYSIYSNLKFDQREIKSIVEKGFLTDIYNVNKQISIPEIENDKVYNIEIIPEINSYTIKENRILYEANLKIEILFNSNNSVETKTIEIPFNFEINSDSISENDNIKTMINIVKEEINTSLENIDINISVEFNTTLFNNEFLNLIENISIEESRTSDIYSMVIYFVKKGDTLWKIAKKFRSTIEAIANANGIDDINKIYPGEQLYIPKYVKKHIA